MQRLSDLMAIRRDPGAIGSRKCGVGPPEVALFLAPQSLVVFALATSIVATTARAARTIGHASLDSNLPAFAAAVLVGGLIFVAAALDVRTRPTSARGWAIAAVAAAVNTLVLFAAALGIDKF